MSGVGYKRKRGRSWQLQVYKDDGSRHFETFHGNSYQADKRLSELTTDIERGDFVEPSKKTLYTFLIEEFLPHIKTDKDEDTYLDYEGITENHIKKSELGRKIITDIKNRDIEIYKTWALNRDRIDGRLGKLSAKTVKNHIIMIKAAFNYMCYLDIFENSPIQKATFPKVPKFIPVVYTPEQASALIEAGWKKLVNSKDSGDYRHNFKLYLYILLCIYTGVRQGELRGLTWSAVNFDTCLFSITQQARGSGKKAKFKDPKTDESVSTVSFDLEFVSMLERLRKDQIHDIEKCSLLKEQYNDRHLVFSAYNGNVLDRKVITRYFESVCDMAGIPVIRLHDLRHSCATLLLGENVPLKVIQERLRHKDIRTTGNIYSHVSPKMQEEANQKMSKVLKFKRA